MKQNKKNSENSSNLKENYKHKSFMTEYLYSSSAGLLLSKKESYIGVTSIHAAYIWIMDNSVNLKI